MLRTQMLSKYSGLTNTTVIIMMTIIALLFFNPFLCNTCEQLWKTLGKRYSKTFSLLLSSPPENHMCSMKTCVVTWPQPKSVPFGGACPSRHHVDADHLVNSQHQRHRSRALGKDLCPQPVEPARCGRGRHGPWL